MNTSDVDGNDRVMLFCPSVGVWDIDGDYYFDRKFYDGLLAYCSRWPGEIRLAIRAEKREPPQFGLIRYEQREFPASLVLLAFDEKISAKYLQDASIVFASGDNHKNLHLASLCSKSGVKCVYCIEYILETRLQIALLTHKRLMRRIKCVVWLLLMELKRRREFRLSDGLMSNGVPAYNQYRKLIGKTLLYFDTRTTEKTIITEKELNEKLEYLDRNLPLRLGFSGRLIGMKGVDHLVEVARELNKKKVPFTLDIFGGGDMVPLLIERIHLYGLSDKVILRGVVDFSKELVPYVKSSIDLYVVCHLQSDPSCTYLETYACGVPIAGYDNRAHQGILNICDVGWSSPMKDVPRLAELIHRLHENRGEIKRKSINAKKFAEEHTFEKTTKRRISYIEGVLNAEESCASPVSALSKAVK